MIVVRAAKRVYIWDNYLDDDPEVVKCTGSIIVILPVRPRVSRKCGHLG